MSDPGKEVKQANKVYFDEISSFYEEIDGRRGFISYVQEEIKLLRADSAGGIFLDLGCGTGFLMEQARKYFKEVIGVDISLNMLKEAQKRGFNVVCADVENLPFKDKVFSGVGAFSVLHHCFDLDRILREAFRVTEGRGFFYSDHDIDRYFVKKFNCFLSFYRFFRNIFKRTKLKDSSLASLEKLVEYREKGIERVDLEEILKRSGYRQIKISVHFRGLSPLLEKLGFFRLMRAFPLVSVKAQK